MRERDGSRDITGRLLVVSEPLLLPHVRFGGVFRHVDICVSSARLTAPFHQPFQKKNISPTVHLSLRHG